MPNISSYSNLPNHLYEKIQQINKEYNEYLKNHDIVNPKNDGSTEIKIKNQYNDIHEFIKQKSREQQKKYYAETSGMSKQDRARYVYRRYYDKNAAHYIGDGLTKQERSSAHTTELTYKPEFEFSADNEFDPMFRGLRSIIHHGFSRMEEENLFNRKKINQAISNILEKNDIKLPQDKKLSFSIEPFSYKISIEGLEDEDLKNKFENALNVGKNGRNLFSHVWQTLPGDSTQRTDDILDKYSLQTAIRDETGYNINELVRDKEKRTLLNAKGEDVFEVFAENIKAHQLQHLSDSDKEMVVGSYRLKMFEYIDGSLKDTPDMVLKIDYISQKGLFDRDTKKGYGEGQRAWLDGLKEKLTREVAYNEIGNKSLYQNGNFFDSKEIKIKIQDNAKDEDAYLDPKLKAMKIALEQQRVQSIAVKVAKGEKLTSEELKLIRKYNPELLEKAKMAHERAKIFKLNANDEFTKMLMLKNIQKIAKFDPMLGNLLMRAFE